MVVIQQHSLAFKIVIAFFPCIAKEVKINYAAKILADNFDGFVKSSLKLSWRKYGKLTKAFFLLFQ